MSDIGELKRDSGRDTTSNQSVLSEENNDNEELKSQSINLSTKSELTGESSTEGDGNDKAADANFYSSFTQKQLEHLRKHIEEEMEESKNKIAKLSSQRDALQSQKCITDRNQEDLKNLNSIDAQLRDEKIHLDNLIEKSDVIKTAKPKYQSFELDDLPKVVICGKYTNGMPRIAVCSRPKAKEPKRKALNDEFKKVLTPRQMELIEDEKRWTDLTCGQLEMQIAGLKSQLKIISGENNVIKALVEKPSAPAGKRSGKKAKNKGKKHRNTEELNEEEDSPEVLAISISSKLLSNQTDNDSVQEVSSLRSSLSDARKSELTLRSQQDALKRLRDSLAQSGQSEDDDESYEESAASTHS